MTENHGDQGLQKLDVTVELEKREALEYFRTELAELRLRSAIARQAGKPRVAPMWAIPVTASALVAFGLLLIVVSHRAAEVNRPDSSRASTGIPGGQALEVRTVEKALLRFQPLSEDRRGDSPCLVAECRRQADRNWLIEAAICRSRRSHIRDEEVGKMILSSFGVGRAQVPAPEPVSDEFVRRLESRIQQTTIERALVRRAGRVTGS